MPKERRAYAREVIVALARGTNSLPPDPEQAAALKEARAKAEIARAEVQDARTALAEAEQRGQELVGKLDTACARAEAAEWAQMKATEALQASEKAVAAARTEADRFQAMPGLKGKLGPVIK